MSHVSNGKYSVVQAGKIKPTSLSIQKLGIVSRDYRKKFSNGYRDFSCALGEVLNFLDDQKCDAALFSLFSIVPRKNFKVKEVLKSLKHIKSVFLEEFCDRRPNRKAKRFVVYYRSEGEWKEYELHQIFGSLNDVDCDDMNDFVENEMPKRSIGNCCILLCGESNGVKYSKARRVVEDTFGLRRSIPSEVKVILNPVHDRMTRFEMRLKREFLSENGRCVISVWNKGKTYRNRRTRNGTNPAWTIFCNGEEITIEPIQNEIGLEVGLLEIVPTKRTIKVIKAHKSPV